MEHLTNKLQSADHEAGFLETGLVDIAALRFEPEIRRICQSNGCGNYGTSWACPPAIGTLEECRQRCMQYSHMLLFSGCFELEDSFDFEGMTVGMKNFKTMTETFDRLAGGILDRYLLLSNEGCGRCSRCTYPDAPCRFPDKLYHSIEGYGFHVGHLAQCAGIRYNNGPNTVTFFGAILF